MKEFTVEIPATLHLTIRAKSINGARAKVEDMPTTIHIDYRDLPLGYDATVAPAGTAKILCTGEVHTGLSYTVDRFCSRKGA